MQNYLLTVDKFLDHAAKWHGTTEVVTNQSGKTADRIGYESLRARSNQLSGALLSLGLRPGDRVATLAWNTQSHIEMYYAIMGCGLVCHTLNPRVTTAHIVDIINEAEDRVIAVSVDLIPTLETLLPLCPSIEQIVILESSDDPLPVIERPHRIQVWSLEDLIETRGDICLWGQFQEDAPAGLCYTSGTTGKPKGVLYTHRSNYLHTLRALQADAMALRSDDAVLVAVPMYHANGWGLPFSAPATGAKLVLPGRKMDGESLTKLMLEENVTIAAGVQTVWLGVMEYLDQTGQTLPALKRVIIGGSKCPEAFLLRMRDRLDAEIQTSWGMTELSPLGTSSAPNSVASDQASGRPLMGLDLKLTDEEGATLSEQRCVVGHLKVKGHSVVDRYYKAGNLVVDEQGYFDTGDLASIDESGNLTICGRSKDLIKSGGEWINPAEIEEIVGSHPDVNQVAVIDRADPKWGERPVLIVELSRGSTLEAEDLLALLRGKIAAWWVPDEVVVTASMPLAATGKIDKIRLKSDFNKGSFVAA